MGTEQMHVVRAQTAGRPHGLAVDGDAIEPRRGAVRPGHADLAQPLAHGRFQLGQRDLVEHPMQRGQAGAAAAREAQAPQAAPTGEVAPAGTGGSGTGTTEQRDDYEQ